MQYRIKTTIFDPLSIKALDSLIASRKMSRFISEAVAYYVRTKDGKALLEVLSKDRPAEKKQVITTRTSRRVEDKQPPQPQRVDIGGFLSLKQE